MSDDDPAEGSAESDADEGVDEPDQAEDTSASGDAGGADGSDGADDRDPGEEPEESEGAGEMAEGAEESGAAEDPDEEPAADSAGADGAEGAESDAADESDDGGSADADEEAAAEEDDDEETEADEGDGEEETDLVPEVSEEDLDARLEEAEADLEVAETESDLDDVEARIDGIEEDLERADLPEPDEDDEDEDAADPREEFETRIQDLRDELESQRGPYAEDVVDDVEAAQSTLRDTQWTESGRADLPGVVESFLADVNEALGSDCSREGDDPESLADSLDEAIAAVEGADLGPDEDAETIDALVEATGQLSEGLDEAEEWDDLQTHEQLRAQGFYDPLGHYKDFPPELSAIKEHERRGNVDMVLLALDSMQSEFMEEHCLKALTRMGDPAAFDAMSQRAGKRDKPGIRALGKMGAGAEEAVDTLLEYVDADKDPALQKVTFKALGEIGHADAVQPLANKLEMDSDAVRPHAARALGLIGDARAVDPLVDVAENDEVDTVRASALWALRQIGTEEALEAAAEHADEDAFVVQTEAVKAREALNDGREEATA